MRKGTNSFKYCHTCRQHYHWKQSYSHIHIRPPKRQFNPIACDLIGFFTLQVPRETHIYSHAHVSTYFPKAIPIPDKMAGTGIQAYLQHVYATFSDTLTFKIYIGKEY